MSAASPLGATVFPNEPAQRFQLPPDFPSQVCMLRWARMSDLSFLRILYADTRRKEMASVPWPEAAKASFLDQQFDAQHRHYLHYYADADFLILERGGEAVGRLYLQRCPPDHLLVDISLLAAAQGQGIGSALILSAQRECAALGRGLRLHVHRHNADALRLYRRLGFVLTEPGETHHGMRWTAQD